MWAFVDALRTYYMCVRERVLVSVCSVSFSAMINAVDTMNVIQRLSAAIVCSWMRWSKIQYKHSLSESKRFEAVFVGEEYSVLPLYHCIYPMSNYSQKLYLKITLLPRQKNILERNWTKFDLGSLGCNNANHAIWNQEHHFLSCIQAT